ncbi:MAG: hypothetical protein FVQ82_10720 [Planctomycetes bacterium]|nr:hypothetical protein [Planctomycetota bacterium]
MGGLRGKLLVALIIYFAGFGSAIYYQAPALEGPEITRHQMSEGKTSGKKDVITRGEVAAKKVHEDLLKFYSFAEEKASKVGALIKARLDEQ